MAKDKKIMEGQLSLFDFFAEKKQEKSTDIKKESALSSKETAAYAAKGFAQCQSCWCRDCRHNAVNEAIPRDICGREQACPACAFCVQNGEPDICVIGSATEGCSVRAGEEGLKSDAKWEEI